MTQQEIEVMEKREATAKKNQETVQTHGKGLYRVVRNGKTETLRLGYSTFGDILVMNKNSRKFGYIASSYEFESLEPVSKRDVPEAVKWEKGWRKVLKYLKASGFWQDIQQEILDGLDVGLAKIKEAGKVEWEEGKPYESRNERIKAVDERLLNTFIRWHMSRPPKMKAMYFSKNPATNAYYKSRIAEAIRDGKAYDCHTTAGYDVSFEFHPEDKGNRGPHAHYAEEFRGCGNGHYYIALDATHALFMEDD